MSKKKKSNAISARSLADELKLPIWQILLVAGLQLSSTGDTKIPPKMVDQIRKLPQPNLSSLSNKTIVDAMNLANLTFEAAANLFNMSVVALIGWIPNQDGQRTITSYTRIGDESAIILINKLVATVKLPQ